MRQKLQHYTLNLGIHDSVTTCIQHLCKNETRASCKLKQKKIVTSILHSVASLDFKIYITNRSKITDRKLLGNACLTETRFGNELAETNSIGTSRMDRPRNENTRRIVSHKITLVEKVANEGCAYRTSEYLHNTSQIFTYKTARQNTGRQRKRSIDNAKEDLIHMGSNMQKAVDLLKDRQKW